MAAESAGAVIRIAYDHEYPDGMCAKGRGCECYMKACDVPGLPASSLTAEASLP